MNKEKFDYSGVKESDRLMAERWYMAPKPSSSTTAVYHQWRVWNVSVGARGNKNDKYKGDLIIEKATGRSVSPPPCESYEEDDEEDDEEEVTEATEAMAAVRVE